VNAAADHRPPPPRALLFDWDDTLVDNWGTIHEALNVTLAAMGRPTWSFEETLGRVRQSSRDGFPRMFGERWQEAQKIFYQAFARDHLETLKALPDAEATLKRLSDAGLYLAVVSNKHGDFLRREAAHLGWSGYFRRLVGAGDAAADKPAVDAVAMALDGSGLDRGPDVWFIGDADIDVECARNAGLTAVLLRGGRRGRSTLADPGDALPLAGCAELLRTVDGLISQL
jgi:phosphoglycolate phosphatase